jgi:hypothetical protein
MPKDSSTSLLSPQQQKAFIKNDMSEELMRFLRDYNKKASLLKRGFVVFMRLFR